MNNSIFKNTKLGSVETKFSISKMSHLINYAVHHFSDKEVEKAFSDDKAMAKWYVDRLKNTLYDKLAIKPYSTYGDCFLDFFLYLDADAQEKLLTHINDKWDFSLYDGVKR